MSSVINPFIYGRALEPAEFHGRGQELHHLYSRLATGQSTAFIGQPHTGKTSLLKYLLDDQIRAETFGNRFERDLFSFLDAQKLRGVKTRAGFWERALAPLAQCLKTGKPEHLKSLDSLYRVAQKNKFGTFELEQLFAGMSAAGTRLMLMLDEFDHFLLHPVLNSAEFYGALRSLASRSLGLVLVIAARKALEELNQLTQKINPYGSPYFNIFTEIKLGAFSQDEISALLDRAGERFKRRDRHYITAVSGGHPYLTQAAAATLWEAIDEGHVATARYLTAGRHLHDESKKHFADTWRLWTSATRKVMTAVALVQLQTTLNGPRLLLTDLFEDRDNYAPEREELKDVGILSEGPEKEWSITQRAFLWWFADELRRNARDDMEFKAWLQAQKMDHLIKSQERKQMWSVVKKVLAATGKGAMTLIETFAEDLAKELKKD